MLIIKSMIKVFLPQNNLNLLNDLNDKILADVVFSLFGVYDFDIDEKTDKRRVGRFIRVVNSDSGEVHYICFSNPNNNSRNAHLMQFVSPMYAEYYKDKAKRKHLNIYLIKPGSNDKTDYIKMFYRCFLTIGINIINLDQLNILTLEPFNSYEDLKSYRDRTSGRNIRNRQIYFTDDDQQVSIYGKTYGANAMESFIFALTIAGITDKKIVFYQVIDNKSKNISKSQKDILINKNVRFGDVIKLLPSGYAKPDQRGGSRNTRNFHYNLLQKFGEKRCYLCGCNIEHLVIGSHIERIADIDKNNNYQQDEKLTRATDGNNGLWLCANHDKMFEFGVIYFNRDLLTMSSSIVDKFEKEFIYDSIFKTSKIFSKDLFNIGQIKDKDFYIREKHFTKKMEEYLNIHKQRITQA